MPQHDPIPETSFIDELQKMAQITSADILIQQEGARLYLNGKDFLHGTLDSRNGVTGSECDEKTIQRMASLAVLLEGQSLYLEHETYCVVVTDLQERARDIAQYITDTLDVPVTPMLLTPSKVNAAFSGEAIFPTDGGHRSAALYGLFDREREG